MTEEAKADELARQLYDFANGLMYQLPPLNRDEAAVMMQSVVVVAGKIVKEAAEWRERNAGPTAFDIAVARGEDIDWEGP